MDKYTLTHDEDADTWRLEKAGAERAIRVFDTKADAMAGLREAVGKSGGMVSIQKMDGTVQEERNYPPED